jgi:hypothetical protein
MKSYLGDHEQRVNKVSEFFNEPNFESESSHHHLKSAEALITEQNQYLAAYKDTALTKSLVDLKLNHINKNPTFNKYRDNS